jgi:hypothetical protein
MERFRLARWLAGQSHFNVPLVTVQSDDWGHLSGGDPQTLSRLLGSSDAGRGGWMADGAETADDLAALAAVLQPLRDGAGRSPCITMNCIVGEADHEVIEASSFERYATRPSSVLPALRQAATDPATAALFDVQLHGAEHVAPGVWLHLLRQGDATLRRFFDARTMPPPGLIARHPGLGAACLPTPLDSPHTPPPGVRLAGAVAMFQALFGRPPTGFVAPNHAWDDATEAQLERLGLRYLQACHVQYATFSDICAGRWAVRRSAASAASNLWHQTRTIDFEPAVRPGDCAAAIRLARLLTSRAIPVVINTHRGNYVHRAGRERAENARLQLANLLRAMLDCRPDLRFVTSSDYDDALRDRLPGVRRLPSRPLAYLVRDLTLASVGHQPTGPRSLRDDTLEP